MMQLGPNDIPLDDLFEIHPERGHRVFKQTVTLFPHQNPRTSTRVHKYKDYAIKYYTAAREVEMAELAGDCGVKVHGRLVKFDVPPNNQPRPVGLVMEIARPLEHYIETIKIESEKTDAKAAAYESEKNRIKTEMIAVLKELHTKYNLVHGDVCLSRFVICQDHKIRLCDFKSARPADESVQIWQDLIEDTSGGHLTAWSGNKMRQSTWIPPTEADDWYALAISVWELYTGKKAFEDIGEGEMVLNLSTGKTVDLEEVKDNETREWIRRMLHERGAAV
ncbi:hypothetical protein TWF481_007805 [Arthrobotrys musiformis]|uniref:Protein kinase domain-containing protein n=1 Tax=Arthrobotrys musiformis TaxID=47236 RepID=A0AAV9W5A2_9PEZI